MSTRGGGKSGGRTRMTAQDYLAERVPYGGALATRAEIIQDLTTRGFTQPIIDRYMQGLDSGLQARGETSTQTVIGPRTFFHDEQDLRAATDQWAAKLSVRPTSLSFAHMPRKWGTMDTAGHMTLSRDLLAVPARLAEYAIVHELAHRLAPNHGVLFQSYLHAFMPDWQARQADLQQRGITEKGASRSRTAAKTATSAIAAAPKPPQASRTPGHAARMKAYNAAYTRLAAKFVADIYGQNRRDTYRDATALRTLVGDLQRAAAHRIVLAYDRQEAATTAKESASAKRAITTAKKQESQAQALWNTVWALSAAARNNRETTDRWLAQYRGKAS